MIFNAISKYVSYLNITSTHIFSLIIGICVSWNLLKSLYQWLRNQKSRPPGPIGLPLVGYLPFLGSEPHKALWEMRKKYGDIIGLYMGTKYTVVLNKYSVTKEVLSHVGALDRAPNLFEHIPHVGFVVENGERWQEQRRFCMSAARDLGLGKGSWEDLIMEEVLNFVQELQKSGGKPVDISHSLGSSISSNIVSLLIGRRLEKEEEADKIQLSVEFGDVSLTYMGPSNPATLVPGLRKLMEFFKIAGYDRAAQIIRKFSNFIREEINRHKSSPELKDVNDFINTYLGKLSTMSHLKNTRHSFSETMLEGNVNLLYLGAGDTIFSSMGWLLRLMAAYRDIQERVHRELVEAVGKEGKARYEERHKIPYTFAVLMESQRFSSIVALSSTRKANQDIPIQGYIIPKGADITSNLWALHNDPNYWSEPARFLPQRFLTDDGTKLVSQPPSYAPFSIGRRNCPGETIAWMEILGYFTEIVKRFEISTPAGTTPEFNIGKGLVSRLSPQDMCFKERK